MALVCNCDDVSLNTGIPSCVSIADITRCLIFDTELDSTGAIKERSVSDIQSFATVETWLNATSFDDRWLPTPELENVENIRDESVFQEFNSGNKAKVRDGFKNFTGYMVQVPRELIGQLKKLACSDIGAYIMDKSGNVLGYEGSTTSVLRPILIDKNTFDIQYVEATDSEVAMVMIKFQWKQSMLDENIKLVNADNVDYTCSDLYGLLDVCGTPVPSTGTDLAVTLTTLYGTNVDGLTTPDFTLNNVTTGLPLAISSATPQGSGVYDVVHTSATTGEVLSLTASKDRYDFTCLADSTFIAL